MNNYKESKQKLDSIREEYGCKGEVIFRTAIQMIVEHGQNTFQDKEEMIDQLVHIDMKHDKAEAEGKCLFMSRSFEKALIECAMELAQIEPYNFLTYVQREVWLGGGNDGEPTYKRAIEIIRNCLCYTCDCFGAYASYDIETLNKFRSMDLEDTEIEYFGWGYLLDAEFEEEE